MPAASAGSAELLATACRLELVFMNQRPPSLAYSYLLQHVCVPASPCLPSADLPQLPAGVTPLKLVTDLLACLYEEAILPTLKEHYRASGR